MTKEGDVGFPAIFDSAATSTQPAPKPGFFARMFGQSQLPEPFIHVRLDEIDRLNAASGKGITVAVVDSGYDSRQADIAARLPCHQFFDAPNPIVTDGTDEWGHGTKMAGIVAAADPNLGIAPGASILPIKVVKEGTPHIDFTAVAAALEWLAEANNEASQKVSVVNMSISTWTNDRDFGPASADAQPTWGRIAKAIERLRERNVVVVAATGNAFANERDAQGMGFPAIVPSVISVAAVHTKAEASRTFKFDNVPAKIDSPKLDNIAPFSQRLFRSGLGLCYTKLMAPGVDIPTVVIKPSEGDTAEVKNWKLLPEYSGTSASAALLSGVVALMQDVHRRKFNALPTCTQIEKWLTASGQQVKDRFTGANFVRLDAFAALSKARNPPTS